jgi:hypothetical protein
MMNYPLIFLGDPDSKIKANCDSCNLNLNIPITDVKEHILCPVCGNAATFTIICPWCGLEILTSERTISCVIQCFECEKGFRANIIKTTGNKPIIASATGRLENEDMMTSTLINVRHETQRIEKPSPSNLNSEPEDTDSIYSAVEILPELKSKYNQYLKPEIVSIRLIQSTDRVWLEHTVEKEMAGYLKDQDISRTDLAFICDGGPDVKMFRPEDDVEYNAKKFIDNFDPYSIINCTDIFTDTAVNRIQKEYFQK